MRVRRHSRPRNHCALLTPGHFPWMDGEAVGIAAVDTIAKHYHEDHEADVQAWLAKG